MEVDNTQVHEPSDGSEEDDLFCTLREPAV